MCLWPSGKIASPRLERVFFSSFRIAPRGEGNCAARIVSRQFLPRGISRHLDASLVRRPHSSYQKRERKREKKKRERERTETERDKKRRHQKTKTRKPLPKRQKQYPYGQRQRQRYKKLTKPTQIPKKIDTSSLTESLVVSIPEKRWEKGKMPP